MLTQLTRRGALVLVAVLPILFQRTHSAPLLEGPGRPRIIQTALETTPAEPVRCVVFSPNGRYLACSTPQRVQLFAHETLQELWRYDSAEVPTLGLRFAPDGETLVAEESTHAVILDVSTGEQLTCWQARLPLVPRRGAPTEEGMLGADLKTVMTWHGSGRLFAPPEVFVRDLATDRVLAQFEHALVGPSFSALSLDGRHFALALCPNMVSLHRLPAGALTVLRLPERTHFLEALVFHADNRTLVTFESSGRLCVWELATGQLRAVVSGPRIGATHITLAPDGRTVALTGPLQCVLCDLVTGRTLAELPNRPGRKVIHVAFSPNSQQIAAACSDSTVRIWDVADLLRPG